MSKLKVFYRPEQSVSKNSSFSPSAGKPAALLKHWQDTGLPIEVVNFRPLTRGEIALAHSVEYVHGVLSLKQSNGFGNHSAEVAKSLRYTTGSFAAAALHAFKKKETAVSLTSGFHHACYDNGGGFCTFNGLVVAAQILRLNGAKRVGIIDCDAHYGNGTQQIMDQLNLEYIRHYTFGGDTLGAAPTSDQWLEEFKKELCNFRDCDVILYQAGADPHINDPLGGALTTEQMKERDSSVFKFCNESNIPIAWNLAGGYQNPLQKVLDLHTNTAIESLANQKRKI